MLDIKSKIGVSGLAIAVLGVLSIILYFFNYNIKLLAWLDQMGDAMSLGIRIFIILVGVALFYFLGRQQSD